MHISIKITGYYCNSWPVTRIHHNSKLLYDGPINGDCVIEHELDYYDDNLLTIEMNNKSFGTNRVWDTVADNKGNILEDKRIIINDIQFNEVSIGLLFKLATFELPNGEINAPYKSINFNGKWQLKFKQPIFDWLITEKYIKHHQNTDTTANRFGSWDNKFLSR